MGTKRNRPRRTVTVDPAVEAHLARDEVNAGRLVDLAISQTVADHKLREALEESEDYDVEDSQLVHGGGDR